MLSFGPGGRHDPFHPTRPTPGIAPISPARSPASTLPGPDRAPKRRDRRHTRPGWTFTPCSSSTISASTMSSSSPSPAISVRLGERPAISEAKKTAASRIAVNDISNIDRDSKLLGARRPHAALQPRQHAVALRQLVQGGAAKYSLLSRPGGPARRAATPSSRTCAPPGTRWTGRPRPRRGPDLRAQQLYSRGILGFTDFTDEERGRFAPVLQRLVRTPPGRPGGNRLSCRRMPATIVGWPVPEARALCATSSSTRRSAGSSTPMSGGNDLVMWDNRAIMHRARRYNPNEVRDLHRTMVAAAPRRSNRRPEVITAEDAGRIAEGTRVSSQSHPQRLPTSSAVTISLFGLMHFGAAMFFTDYSMTAGRLAGALEERGFDRCGHRSTRTSRCRAARLSGRRRAAKAV